MTLHLCAFSHCFAHGVPLCQAVYVEVGIVSSTHSLMVLLQQEAWEKGGRKGGGRGREKGGRVVQFGVAFTPSLMGRTASEFWRSTALEIIQMFGAFVQSLTQDSELAQGLQHNWDGGEHLSARLPGVVFPSTHHPSIVCLARQKMRWVCLFHSRQRCVSSPFSPF